MEGMVKSTSISFYSRPVHNNQHNELIFNINRLQSVKLIVPSLIPTAIYFILKSTLYGGCSSLILALPISICKSTDNILDRSMHPMTHETRMYFLVLLLSRV